MQVDVVIKQVDIVLHCSGGGFVMQLFHAADLRRLHLDAGQLFRLPCLSINGQEC